MKKIIHIVIISLCFFSCNNLITDDSSLNQTWAAEDLNPNSSSYGENINPENYEGLVSMYYFPSSPT
tara:strand:+ start:228 stop:428 length:201 start_codon:yes stop_codon:yes gene_type:complete